MSILVTPTNYHKERTTSRTTLSSPLLAMLELVVHVEYRKKQLDQMRALDPKARAKALRLHFDLLKLPHPPESKIRPPTVNGIVVSYETTKYSPLYRRVMTTIYMQDEENVLKKAKNRCSINRVFVGKQGERKPPVARVFDSTTRSNLNSSLSLDNLSPELVQEAMVSSSQYLGEGQGLTWQSIESQKSYLLQQLLRIQETMKLDIYRVLKLEAELHRLGSPVKTQDSSSYNQRLATASRELHMERRKRRRVEVGLADVLRECANPSVVPMLETTVEKFWEDTRIFERNFMANSLA